MIETIANHIDQKLQPVSGKVFYSGRAAWSDVGGIYVLGFNPGGDPVKQASETVGSHTDFVLTDAPDRWSAYCDEAWKRSAEGEAPLQRRVRHLLAALGLDPRRVPSSNLIFTRSKRSADLGLGTEALVKLCWPVHRAVLNNLQPRAVVCFGVDTGERFRTLAGATDAVDTFREKNDRGWESCAWRSPSGLIVFGLTHPSIADWTKPATDPSPMVKALLRPAE